MTRAGHVLVLTLLASLAAGSPVQAAGAQRFVPAMNAICREESARAQASFDKLPRSSQVDLDLSHSRMTPVAMRYLTQFADVALRFSRPAFERARRVAIVARDEPMRTSYLAANAHMLDVLVKLRAATGRGDPKESIAVFRQTLIASARIGQLDVRYQLTDCGSS